MNQPKCNEMDYINFLIAAQQVFSSVEASQTHPAEEQAPAHDAYTRLLKRLPPDSQALWQEVEPLVSLRQGVLIIDDSTLDKPYALQMDLVALAMMITGIVLSRNAQLSQMSSEVPAAAKDKSVEMRLRRWVKHGKIDADMIYMPFGRQILASLASAPLVLVMGAGDGW